MSVAGDTDDQQMLTHFDDQGRPRMVNVGAKPATDRTAIASGRVIMQPDTLKTIMDRRIAKGDVLTIAELAAIMGAKKTADLIPLCHPLPLSGVDVTLTCDAPQSAVLITATVTTNGRTGVEMEALTAVSVAALTVYDMCKAIDRTLSVTDIQLDHKSGGKSGNYDRQT